MKFQSEKIFNITLNGALDEINDLSSAIDQFSSNAGLPEIIKNQVNLILEELYTNTVNYGFNEIDDGIVSIQLEIKNNVLEMVYQDNGLFFNPLEKEAPELLLSIDDRPIGGLGVFFVKALTDKVEYERDGHFNRLKMFKNLSHDIDLG
jgi:anti-sigma regulatory factor (Ser/Thr protein kinase)